MGYGFTYRLSAGDPKTANEWLHEQPEYEEVAKYGFELRFWTQQDEEDPEKENYMEYDIGDGYNNLPPSLAHNASHVLDPSPSPP